MTLSKDFVVDMLTEPLKRIHYNTVVRVTDENGITKNIKTNIESDPQFMEHYNEYIDMICKLVYSLDHLIFLPFVASMRENGIENIDGWYNGGIRMPCKRMIRFYIMKKDSHRFHKLPLGLSIRFWDYNGHQIITGNEAYDELIRLL